MYSRSWIRNVFASRPPRTLRKTPTRCCLRVEALEERTVLSPVPLTNHEQYLLELLNRARADPAAEAIRQGLVGGINEGLPAGTITTAPKQPLAPNDALRTAMRDHFQDGFDRDFLGHVAPPPAPFGATIVDRAARVGYVWTSLAENLHSIFPTTTIDTARVDGAHRFWITDPFDPARGHRVNLMNPAIKEVGPAVMAGQIRQGGFPNPETDYVVSGQFLGARAGNSFLTGVVYNPNITPDGFYTPGEGLGSVTISAVGPGGTFTETTGSAGGYFLQLAPGTYTVTASGGALGTPITRTVTIGSLNVKEDFTSSGGAPGQLQLSAATSSVNENGGSATITVTRSGGTTGAVSVLLATSNGTATAGSDYTTVSQTLNFTAGQTQATATIPILDDTALEGNETVNLTLSSPTGGATLGSPGTAVLTIVDNEVAIPGTFQFSAATYSVNESGGTAAITVTRSAGTNVAASVNYATSNGTAAAGSDYTSASGTLNFAAGQTQATFAVPILDDTALEGNETVNLALSSPTGGATLGSPNSAVLTIVDNETAIPGTFQFSLATYSVNENGSTATITVTRSAGTNVAASVNYATSNGTATAGQDYNAASGTLNFAAGQTQATFAVPILDDTLLEGNETVNLTLSSPTAGATLGSPNPAVLTIVDNEVAIPGTFQFSAATYSVNETGGSATITVTRSANNVPASVGYATSNGTATAGSDYTSASGTLNFAAGQTSATFTVAITDDTALEGNETVNLALSSPTAGATLSSPSTAVLTIVDNEVAIPGTFQFSAATYSVNENGGSATITVTRSANNVPASLAYTTGGGTATVGSDYTAASGVLDFAAGQTQATFAVTILDDTLLEGDETVNLALGPPTGDATLGSPSTAVLTIVDNEVAIPGTFQFSAATYSVNESGGTATITVTRSAGTNVAASVNYATSNGTATAGTDYTAASGTLNFAAGQTQATFAVPILEDTALEGNETVNVALSSPTAGATLGSPNSAVLTIVDNEVATGSIAGVVYNDLNGDGIRQSEPGLPNWTVYLDLNNNGVRDTAPGNFSSTDVPVALPDFPAPAVFSNLVVPDWVGTVTDVNLNFHLMHTFDGDLEIYLISPNNTRILVVNRAGFSGHDYGDATTDTVLDDQAATSIHAGTAPFLGSFRPSNPLSDFNGQAGAGTWRLEIGDLGSQDLGTLIRWSLTITSQEPGVQSDSAGRYQLGGLTGLPPATYTVREVPQAGWTQTEPPGGAHTVMLAPAEHASGRNFGNNFVPPSTLQVLSFTPTNSGFTAVLSRPLDVAAVNLYDVSPAILGPADITVVGNTTGTVAGSLVFNAAGDTITFVRTGDLLSPDTYTVTLRSAADGFKDTMGNLLDGNADGTAGDNYTTTFTVAPSTAVVVSIPDFTRGPGQTVNVPADSTGLRVRLSDGSGINSVQLTLRYNPALLNITAATSLVGGFPVTFGGSAGQVTIHWFNPVTTLPAGPVEIVRLTANVPDTAPYTSKHVLDIITANVSGPSGAIPSRDDDAIHVAGYFGDTSGNAGYSALDAQRALRVAVGLDSGFAAYQLADPRIIADINANGQVNATDATRILQESVGMDAAQIPALPGVIPPIVPGGPDPFLNIPTGFSGRPGDVLTVPVNLDLSDGLESADLSLSYDASRLEVLGVERGNLTGDFDLFAVNLDARDGTIRAGLGRSAGPLFGRGSGSVLEIMFRVRKDALAGPTILNLRRAVGDTITQLNEGGLDLIPDPSDEEGDVLDGLVLVLDAATSAKRVNGDGSQQRLHQDRQQLIPDARVLLQAMPAHDLASLSRVLGNNMSPSEFESAGWVADLLANASSSRGANGQEWKLEVGVERPSERLVQDWFFANLAGSVTDLFQGLDGSELAEELGVLAS